MCIPVLLSLLTEVAQDCISHDAEGQEEQLSVTLRIIANIFQKILEVMAHRLRKDKEEGREVSIWLSLCLCLCIHLPFCLSLILFRSVSVTPPIACIDINHIKIITSHSG